MENHKVNELMTLRGKEKEVSIELKEVSLKGILAVPEEASGIVIFSHGSGSSRLSKRNNYVARELQSRGLATLLFDLLTAEEDEVYETRFDINLLTHRLIAVKEWLQRIPETKELNAGFFGASTGAASALRAAATLKKEIKAVVSRGGRPDLAMEELPAVQAPTLLLVGGDDETVIQFNQLAYERLQSEKKMEIIPGASHLFGEPGKLEEVAKLSAQWFIKYL